MSWMVKLYESYENGVRQGLSENGAMWPVSHVVKNAHLEVVIDIDGNFLKGRAKVLNGRDSPTLIPATESSAGRSGAKIAPHPLSDEIGYCAADYPKAKKAKVEAFLAQLGDWARSNMTHPKVQAVFKYLSKQTLWHDLIDEFEFPLKVKKENGTSQKIAAEKVFIRWCVEEAGNPVAGTWLDDDLVKAWIAYDKYKNSTEDFCYVSGKKSRIASNHPRFLRWPGDGAKLVSSNDSSGFTFRGRFTDSKKSIKAHGLQAVAVSFEVSQKAHNALRWLISRQGFRNDSQVYVAWAVSGKKIPDPMKNSWEMLKNDPVFQENPEPEAKREIDHSIDLGSSFAHKFRKYLAGYHARLEPTEQIVIMGLDSATPGRMSIIYYRELLASEFLERVERWHEQFAWPQRYNIDVPDNSSGKSRKKITRKTIWPPSSPAPRSIVETAYGDIIKSNDALKKSTIERILPCIVDGRSFPRDLVESAVRRTCNRNNCEKWEWEKNLGVACALFKGYYRRHPNKTKRREYAMALEEDRTTRDYLYGRLLAVAEYIEEKALREERPTTAARLMQKFADRPFSTWRIIELALQPYMQRLKGNRAGFLVNRQKELDLILNSFDADDFISDKSLTGEFLLGYHCQRQFWKENKTENDHTTKEENHESRK